MTERPGGIEPGFSGDHGPSSAVMAMDERRWMTAVGAALMILGFLAILLPFVFTLAIDVLVGVLLVIAGAMQILHGARHGRTTRVMLRLLLGLLYIVAGVLLIGLPMVGVLALTLVLGSYFVAVGVVRIVAASEARPLSGWGWSLFGGVLSVLLGLIIWAGWPATATWAIGLLVGIDLFMAGWTVLALPLAARAAPARRAA